MKNFSNTPTTATPAVFHGFPSLFEASSFRRLARGLPLAVLALAVCWLLFFAQLRGEWDVNPQYNYGYMVPLLGLALFWRRWPERPAAEPGSGGRAALGALIFFLPFLPLRIVLQANPEWRLVYWLSGVQVLGLSFCLLYRLGGWRWVRFFAPPLAFLLIATPWPMQMEQAIIQSLMRGVAGMTVSIADWLGIPAIQHGNLVEVSAGVVGIDEACSGVRSLQSALMLSLFLGEMYRFPLLRRIGLVVVSFLFVLAANLARTTFLVWAAANRGLHQMESWHDAAGTIVMVIVLPSLLLLAYILRPRGHRPNPSAAPTGGILPRIPRWVGIAAFAWLGASALGTEAWFRLHEARLVDTPRWSVAWPKQNPQFKQTAVPEKSLAILRCSNSESGEWSDDSGNHWSGILLRWKPGKNSTQLAKGHRPDICFPAAGAKFLQDLGQVMLPAGGVALPFRHETFQSGPNVLHVFYCLWPNRVALDEKPVVEDGSQASRLCAALAGKRNLGQQVLELVVQGPESNDDAVALVRTALPELIRTEPPAPVRQK